MAHQAPTIDSVLIQWGDRLFYPGNQMVKVRPPPKLGGGGAGHAATMRARASKPPSCAGCRR